MLGNPLLVSLQISKQWQSKEQIILHTFQADPGPINTLDQEYAPLEDEQSRFRTISSKLIISILSEIVDATG